MNRLHTELQRLYAADGGAVRALALELGRPADWTALGRVWRGVQAELQLPAPGIAVSGTDGMQLWFSLQQSISPARAGEFLARLQARYLADVAPARLRALCGMPAVPAQDAASGNWSAFVAPDLAPVFADTPWLDILPGTDGQADLLARLESTRPAAFEAAMLALQPAAAPAAASAPAPTDEPRQFLLRVMNDEDVALALRIEAAKALLAGP